MSFADSTRTQRRVIRWGRAVLFAATFLAAPDGARIPAYTQVLIPRPGPPVDMADPAVERKRIEALNKDRQKNIVSDTEKLLKLAGELDEEAKNSNSDDQVPDEFRKLAAIEKLAHNVKDKMSYTYSQPETNTQFSSPLRNHY